MGLGKAIHHTLHHNSPKSRMRAKVLQAFAEKVGFVYFGSVDQHKDEHEVIRGLTVSNSHRDEHYAVGSFDGYDISIVDRCDTESSKHSKRHEHSWVILQVSLENTATPHIFLKPLGHSPAAYNKFFTALHDLHILNGILDGEHTSEFHSRYELYGKATHSLDLDAVFTSPVTQIIAARFWPHAIEVFEGKLYVYITEHRHQQLGTVLSATLQATTWLASVLDKKET